MFRGIRSLLIVIILLAVFTVSLPSNYPPCIPVLISQVYADSPESWSLKNGTITKAQGLAAALDTAAFHDMVINIDNGSVTSSYTIPLSYTTKTETFTGSAKFTLQGTYSSSAGISGQYNLYIDGTKSSNGKTEPYKLAYTGPFSGPGGLSAGKIVTVSFAEAIAVPIPGGAGNGNPKSYPFEVSFTADNDKSAGLPIAPGTGSNQAPPISKGDYNKDGKVTELDALAALKMSVKLLPEDLVLDMDGNGKVTAADTLLILKKAVGK